LSQRFCTILSNKDYL